MFAGCICEVCVRVCVCVCVCLLTWCADCGFGDIDLRSICLQTVLEIVLVQHVFANAVFANFD